MTQYPDFLKTIFDKCNKAEIVETIGVDELKIHLWSEERGYINWLRKYIGPLMQTMNEDGRDFENEFKVGVFFSDNIVSEVARFIEAGNKDFIYVSNCKHYVQRLIFSSSIIVDYDMEPGMVCAYDLEESTVTIITSAHTTHPMHEIARCIRDLATGYLRGHGWEMFHAGAVQIDDLNYLVLGNKGAGKTSLIIAMLFGGAEYISNDRVFIKSTKDGIQVRPFPMTMAIGLGTALQYPQLKHFITNPGSLSYPRKRFDLEHVYSYPEHKWYDLEDKLQLFSDELVQVFGKKNVHPGGIVSGVLFPQTGEFQEVSIHKPDIEDTRNLIANNYFSWETDPIMYPWRPFNFVCPENQFPQKLIEIMLTLPLVNFSFYANKNLMHEVSNYRKYLQQFIADTY